MVIGRPGMGSNVLAVFAPGMVRSSPNFTTILSWNVPANIFPFKKNAGYPNIGRCCTAGSAGFAFSNVAMSSGGDFFHAIGMIIGALALDCCANDHRRMTAREFGYGRWLATNE